MQLCDVVYVAQCVSVSFHFDACPDLLVVQYVEIICSSPKKNNNKQQKINKPCRQIERSLVLRTVAEFFVLLRTHTHSHTKMRKRIENGKQSSGNKCSNQDVDGSGKHHANKHFGRQGIIQK